MKALLISLVAFSPLALSAAPETSTEANKTLSPAEKLIDLINIEEEVSTTAKASFMPFLEMMKEQGYSDETLKKIEDAAEHFFAKVASDPEFKKDIISVYEQNFTNDELNAIYAFYQTPAGKKTLKTLPVVMSQAIEIGQKCAQKHQASFQEELEAILAEEVK